MIKVSANPELGKFVTARKLIETDNGKKIVVEATMWDKFPQNIEVYFTGNNLRLCPKNLFAKLGYHAKNVCEKLNLPEWKLTCKTKKFDRKGNRIWKVFENPNRRVDKYLVEYGLTIDLAKQIADEMKDFIFSEERF